MTPVQWMLPATVWLTTLACPSQHPTSALALSLCRGWLTSRWELSMRTPKVPNWEHWQCTCVVFLYTRSQSLAVQKPEGSVLQQPDNTEHSERTGSSIPHLFPWRGSQRGWEGHSLLGTCLTAQGPSGCWEGVFSPKLQMWRCKGAGMTEAGDPHPGWQGHSHVPVPLTAHRCKSPCPRRWCHVKPVPLPTAPP